jgi:fructose-1,6-bisphosphatase-3
MWLRRDQALVFHGCVPLDAGGDLVTLEVDGAPRRGRELFDALGRVVSRAFRSGAAGAAERDLDWFWYLWSGPLSPCFGKDKMATFETYFLADKATHHERKNPYWKHIADPAFCRRVLGEFGVDPAEGLIVNGHVPVKPDTGETPLKASGQAITIDGAFAAAYGDRGYSLVLDAERIWLAEHHHFPGADETVRRGADIVPTVTVIKEHPHPRTIADTELGATLRAEIAVLEELLATYAD